MRVLLLATLLSTVVAASVPQAPVLCTDVPELDSFFCPGQDVNRYFMERVGCEEPKLVASACEDPPAEDPDNIAPEAPIDPDFDEHHPTGPGPGPEGALPVDKPRTPPPIPPGEPE